MSKKRKTRKQKEKAQIRHAEQAQLVQVETPIYSIPVVAEKSTSPTKKVIKQTKNSFNEVALLKRDMVSIAAASGIILAFDILLLTLLSSGVLKLNFLGY